MILRDDTAKYPKHHEIICDAHECGFGTNVLREMA